ncbi:MAG: MMPL family transporter, partial [Bacteroidota bacterium]
MSSPRVRILILVVFAGLMVLSVMGLQNLHFEFSFEAFVPKDDPDITYYKAHKKKIPRPTSGVTIGITREAGVFNRDFLADVHDFCKKARKLPTVQEANSLVNTKDFIYDPNFPIRVKVLDWKDSEDLKADSVRIMNDQRWKNTFISENGTMLLVYLGLPRERPDTLEASFNIELKKLLDSYEFDSWHAIGYPIMHHVMIGMQQGQFGLYVLVGMLMMLASMIFVFRRFWGIFFAFFLVFLGMLYFFGLIGGLGQPLDLMSTMFPILMVIVGTSDVVHIMTKYVDELNKGHDRDRALRTTIREIGLATFMTSLTTAIGFLSLISSKLPPIRNWGIMSAIGVFIAFTTVMLLTIALISRFKANRLMRPISENRGFDRIMERIYRFTKERSRPIVIGTVILMGLCVYSATQINMSLTATRDFPRGSDLLADFQKFDKETHGVNSIEFAVEAGEGKSFHDLEVMQAIERFEEFARSKNEFGPIISPIFYYKISNRAFNGNNPDHYRLPESQDIANRQRELLQKYLKGRGGSMISEDGRFGNMYLRLPDIGSKRTWKLNEEIDNWIAENTDPAVVKFRHTGHRYIFDKNQGELVFSLMRSLGIAIVLVSFFMALVFRSFKMVIVSLIPNLVPLLITAGLIGLLGLEFDPKIAVVFTVAFGIAVDDSIHFLSRFKLELDKGMSVDEAIHATFMETG